MPITTIVIVSDLHAGCQMGLCPKLVRRDFGGEYTRSAAQAVVWRWWETFWSDFVPAVTQGEDFTVLVNGDLVDGVHHGSTTQISHNMSVQRDLAERILAPVHDKCRGSFFVVRGTPAHAGESSEDEESIARYVGSIPDQVGQYARPELWIRVGDFLVHAMHHVGGTSSNRTEANALMAEMGEEFAWAGRIGEQAPDVVIRSHRHCNIEVNGPTPKGRFYSFSTSGWQLKTPFVYKIAGGRIAPPQFGGSVVRVGKQGLETHHFTKMVKRAKAVG